jgi:hypothetical protein
MKLNRPKPELIKKISDELAQEMKNQIIPVFRHEKNQFDDGASVSVFTDMDKVHISNVAYTWIEDVPKDEIGTLFRNDASQIISFHEWAYYGFFKPSLYEVYCAINQAFGEDWKKFKYFWLDSGDMGTEHIIGDFHWCRCFVWEEDDLWLPGQTTKPMR